MNIYDYLEKIIPSDHSRQSRAIDVVGWMKAEKKLRPSKVLDLGCGIGATRSIFQRLFPEAQWVGVDISSSPEVNARQDEGSEFVTYDGVSLPFPDESFDLVFSNQVLEHVRYPEKVLSEVRRVLEGGGLFVGQTSQLEPYHSFSYWNFTIYGFVEICKEAGLDTIMLRPGIDGPTLIERSYLGRPEAYSKWFKEESPFNQIIESQVREQKRPAKIANFRKILYCGQFVFVCRPSLGLGP
ncbi:class I SAM-dependent methyltransferase [Nitratireductor sp. OM-1]|uniref:class I SAM-dependent methyltransferase n=1 Tax=Nitratireductor sp. OM-1 TaxID=1756988 RepID=UPI000DDEB3B0|nr:class I SAM-dependent methyltransferase [Nitratireductor sp. OM-1]